jgi:hypothetical protein
MAFRLLVVLGLMISPTAWRDCADCPGAEGCGTADRACACCTPILKPHAQQEHAVSAGGCCGKSSADQARSTPASHDGRQADSAGSPAPCACCGTPARPDIPPIAGLKAAIEPGKTKATTMPLHGLPAMDVRPGANATGIGGAVIFGGSACDRQAALCVWRN